MIVPEEEQASAPSPDAGDPQDSPADASLEDLRQILFRRQIKKIESLEANLDRLEYRVNDEQALVKMIAPVLGEAIRLRIHEARDEIIEALYPVIGKVVQRAVGEAVSDLARSLDAQVKRSFNFRLVWYRLRARLSGASDAQIGLRELLPFTVSDVLLIHRETGLLLYQLASEFRVTSDVDLFSGMLTAINDFSRDTLGGEDEGGLGEITYLNQHIMIESGRHAYLAVIVNGVPPAGFKAEMRQALNEIESVYAEPLKNYQGDSSLLAPVEGTLTPLMTTGAPQQSLSTSQKRLLAGALGGLAMLVVVCGLFTFWVFRLGRLSAPPAVAILPPTATLVPTATQTPTSTATPTPTFSPTPTLTSTPTLTPTAIPSSTPTSAVIFGVTLGNVYVRTRPALDSPRTGVVLPLGDKVELLAEYGDWVRVRKLLKDQYSIDGWIPLRWFGTSATIPTSIITPTASP
jgi:hypothetical protein